jgi:hypothetical protein
MHRCATPPRATMNKRTSSFTYTDCLAGFRPMARTMCCIAILFGMSTYVVQAQTKTGTLLGYVYDETSKTGIPNARITVYRNDHDFKTGNTDLIQGGCNTDMHGLFCRLSGLGFDSTYVFVVSAPGYRTVPIKNCPIKFSLTFLEVGLQLSADTLPATAMHGGCANEWSEQVKEVLCEREKSRTYSDWNSDGMVGSFRGARDTSSHTYYGCLQDSDGAIGLIKDGPVDTYIDGVKVRGNSRVHSTDVTVVILGGTPAENPKEPMPPILNGTPATEAQPAATDPQ